MSFRGHGRGGGGRGGGFGYDHPAKHAPHEDFPDITLPEMCAEASNGETLIESTLKLEEFWRSSCYHLEEDAPKKKNEDKEIERFSDNRKRKGQSKREALALYLKLTLSNFPAELVLGSRRGQASNKKLRWDKDSDEQAFEVFEKLEQKHKDGSKVETGGDDEDEQEEEEVKRRRKIQTMTIIRISSLMTMMMTGTKRMKHRRLLQLSVDGQILLLSPLHFTWNFTQQNCWRAISVLAFLITMVTCFSKELSNGSKVLVDDKAFLT